MTNPVFDPPRGGTPDVRFGPHTTPQDVTPHAYRVLVDILRASGEKSCLVSSTRRSAPEQARVMFENLERDWAPDHKADRQHALYGPFGDQVIDVYEAGKRAGNTPTEIIVAMTDKILELGPYKVSHHAADPAIDHLCVFDVAPSSLEDQHAFVVAAVRDKRVERVLTPWKNNDPGIHLEIPEPA